MEFREAIERLQGVYPNESVAFPLLKDDLEQVNAVDSDGNLLMQAAERGTDEDLRYLLRIQGLKLNKRNSRNETAADILWRMERYEGLMLALKKDSAFPADFKIANVKTDKPCGKELVEFVRGRNELHTRIEKGDVDFIKTYTSKNVSSIYYGDDNTSALSRASDHDQNEIFQHLLSCRPKFSVPSMDLKQRRPSKVLENSFVLKLADKTVLLEGYDREHWEAVINMYLELQEEREIRCLMEAIRNEDFQILFRITECTLKTGTKKAFGFTSAKGKINIAAQDLVTKDGQKDVHRVFAHELCHLVMILMYKNVFHPFPRDDEKRKSEYWGICKACESIKSTLDPLIQRAYDIDKKKWMEELIVRVPEIVAVYGKEKSAIIFKEQIPSLLKYYNDYIIPDCEEFSCPDYYRDELKEIKNIPKDHLGIRDSHMDCSPFQEVEDYEDYRIPWETTEKRIFILPTESPTLTAAHIFHQFKRSHPLHSGKIFLAFRLEHYHEHQSKKIIHGAFKSQSFKKLVLLLSRTHHDTIKCQDVMNSVLQNIRVESNKEKEVIFVVPKELCEEWKANKFLTYHWKHLTEKFQSELMRKKISQQGKETTLERLLGNATITSELLKEILEQRELSVGQELWGIGHLNCLGNKEKLELYIERSFVIHKFKKIKFSAQELPFHRLYITGLAMSEIEKMTKKDWVQGVKSGDDIQRDSYIFLPRNEKEATELFENIRSFFHGINEALIVFWLHYENGEFLVRECIDHENEKFPIRGFSSRLGSNLADEIDQTQYSENEMILETAERRVILVADDPGSGKSTSARSVMDKIKEKNTENFIWKVHFEDLLSEDRDEFTKGSKNCRRILMRICKMNSRFEEEVFPLLVSQRGRVVLFLDGYDEISEELRPQALEILKSLRDETEIQLWVLTRRHFCSLQLELEMNAVSFSLTHFSEDDQLRYLNGFWERKLKDICTTKDFRTKFCKMVENVAKYADECGLLHQNMQEVLDLIKADNQSMLNEKIVSLDFLGFSKMVMKIVKNRVFKLQSVPPLWLWMMANIIIERNLCVPDRQDIFKFYSEFSKIRIDLFLREKCELKLERKCQIRLYKRTKKQIEENLLAFSDELFGSKLFESGQISQEDLEELEDVGLVKKVGRGYRFVHKTFGDFFFTQAIIRYLNVDKQRKVDNRLLEKLLCPNNEYLGVKNFLHYYIKQNKSQRAIFPKDLLEEPQFSNAFLRCCPFRHSLTSKEIALWRRVIQECEELLDGNELDVLFKKIDEKLSKHEDPELFLDQVFSLAFVVFGRKQLHKLCDKLKIEEDNALSVCCKEGIQ